jgi:predicted RNA methylase
MVATAVPTFSFLRLVFDNHTGGDMFSAWLRIRDSIVKRGAKRTAQSAISILQDHIFDFLHGTNTVRKIRQDALTTVGAHKKEARDYVPTRGRAFLKLMERVAFPKGGVFVDFGSGKGKILLLASQLGFKRVVGVEFSPYLCDLANQNILEFGRRVMIKTKIEIVCLDAAEYRIPDDANVFFMFNPFGRAVMESVVANIEASLRRWPRELILIYTDPCYFEVIRQLPDLRETGTFVYGGYEFSVFSNFATDYLQK